MFLPWEEFNSTSKCFDNPPKQSSAEKCPVKMFLKILCSKIVPVYTCTPTFLCFPGFPFRLQLGCLHPRCGAAERWWALHQRRHGKWWNVGSYPPVPGLIQGSFAVQETVSTKGCIILYLQDRAKNSEYLSISLHVCLFFVCEAFIEKRGTVSLFFNLKRKVRILQKVAREQILGRKHTAQDTTNDTNFIWHLNLNL